MYREHKTAAEKAVRCVFLNVKSIAALHVGKIKEIIRNSVLQNVKNAIKIMFCQ
jgi:hypothetical protein